MENTVNIPESVKDIKNAITRRITILAEWNTMLARSRKDSLRASRQLQVNATQQQILELRQALGLVVAKEQTSKAQALISRLAPVRKDFENGLFERN